MNTKSILSILTAAALCAGCEGTGPNTQNGAVAGGALGALAGGIIGNNSGGHNGLGGALIGGAIGAIAGGTMGNNVDHQNGTIYHSEYDATTNVAVPSVPPPPPPPAELQTAQPTPSAVWIYGY
jgi:phage tail tape-measure protein